MLTVKHYFKCKFVFIIDTAYSHDCKLRFPFYYVCVHARVCESMSSTIIILSAEVIWKTVHNRKALGKLC